MPYEIDVSCANPRLLILLTHQSEESVGVINRLIDQQSQINFDGEAPKNRCFISVIGYNHRAKELCSGWIRDLDANPVRREKLKKKVADGAGGIVDVEVIVPVWIEPLKHKASFNHYSDAIKIARNMSELWVKNHALSPIVLDCSYKCYTEYAIEDIQSMKSISAEDGKTLFFGCYIEEQSCYKPIFSKIPKEWEYLLIKNEYENKTLNLQNVLSFFYAISF